MKVTKIERIDVKKKLTKIDNRDNPKWFFLPPHEWSQYEATLPKRVLDIYAEGGYYQAYNPLAEEYTHCLFFKGKPVFVKDDD